MSERRKQSGRGRRLGALAMCLLGLALGLVLVVAGDRDHGAAAAETVDSSGSASAMSGIAYNAPQGTVHGITLPPGGSNNSVLNYAYPSNTELLLSSSSSTVNCGSSGGQPGQSAVAFCEVDITDFVLHMEGFNIVTASRIRARASVISSSSGSQASHILQTENLCIRSGLNGPCHNPKQGETVIIDWPPLSGTITIGSPVVDTAYGGDVRVTVFHVNIFNADYTDSQGNASVIIDIANAHAHVDPLIPTPTPTRTPTKTPTKTPTPTGTPSVFKALMPGLSKDE